MYTTPSSLTFSRPPRTRSLNASMLSLSDSSGSNELESALPERYAHPEDRSESPRRGLEVVGGFVGTSHSSPFSWPRVCPSPLRLPVNALISYAVARAPVFDYHGICPKPSAFVSCASSGGHLRPLPKNDSRVVSRRRVTMCRYPNMRGRRCWLPQSSQLHVLDHVTLPDP
jgi:hypothetical protein